MGLLIVFSRIILLAFIAVSFCLLCVPFKYKINGEYNRILVLDFSVFCTPLFGVRGRWENAPEKFLQVQVIAAGLPLSFNLEKQAKNKSKNKGKEKKERKRKEKGRNKLFPAGLSVLSNLDKELIGGFYIFLKDVLKMLKPSKVKVGGRIGFSEPHYNGWLSAMVWMLRPLKVIKLWIETAWEEECYEFYFAVAGKVTVCGILFRLAQFLLKPRTRKFLRTVRKEKTLSVAGTIF